MNIHSAMIDKIRRLGARHQRPRIVEKRTYVLFIVPFDFSKNGRAKKSETAQVLLGNHTDSDSARSYALALARTEIRGVTKTTGEADVDDEPQLDFRLMWTWFLPNPLWKPKRRE